MSQPAGVRTPEGEKATEVMLATFRANGLLLAAGGLLAAEHGLTSARWQVLGAVILARQPLTVPQIARRMGLTRQSVHTTVSHLLSDGLVELAPNADHRRSSLVSLTEQGRAAYEAVDREQAIWASQLAAGFAVADLEVAACVLGELSARLETSLDQERNEQGADHER